MLTFSTSLQYIASCKSVVPCVQRLHQFLSALALGLRPWARADKTDAAWYNYYFELARTIKNEYPLI